MITPNIYFNDCLFFYENKFVWIISFLIYLVIIFECDIKINNLKLLNNIKKIWNFLLFLFSLVGFYNIFTYTLFLYNNYGLQSIIDQNYKVYDFRNNKIYFWCKLFIISKLFELFDTILIKLSGKKPIFLHWYHHVVTLGYSYFLGVNYEYSSVGLILALMNFFVHTIMYFYYTLIYFLNNTNFIKKYSFIITFVQILQMFGAIFSYLYLYIFLNYKLDYFGLFMYIIYAILFINLFYKKINYNRTEKIDE